MTSTQALLRKVVQVHVEPSRDPLAPGYDRIWEDLECGHTFLPRSTFGTVRRRCQKCFAASREEGTIR